MGGDSSGSSPGRDDTNCSLIFFSCPKTRPLAKWQQQATTTMWPLHLFEVALPRGRRQGEVGKIRTSPSVRPSVSISPLFSRDKLALDERAARAALRHNHLSTPPPPQEVLLPGDGGGAGGGQVRVRRHLSEATRPLTFHEMNDAKIDIEK